MSRALDDEALLRGFESCALGTDAFGHREHVRVAWLYLRAAPFEEAALKFCTSLRRFAAAKGVPGLYHETITWAYLAVINERRDACASAESFDAFADANPDLFDKAMLAALYDGETLRSERARRVFVLPRHAPKVTP